MSKPKSKIEVASPEEVAQYATDSATREPETSTAQTPEDELTSLRKQLTEAQDKYLRAKAEAQNIVRRIQQEKTDAICYGNAELLKAVVAVVDDFERTLEAAENTSQADAVVEGIKLVYDKLMKLLKDNAVEAIESLGKPFDPTEHAAMMQQPSDQCEPGTVIQEVQRGYRYRDRILRPAQVVVASSEPQESPKS
ncbi:MAG: nucleotide exchange factor GrpE [Phycisphaerae bacterium]|nr:nucleotide exchange factor GrpE [Phycisphaerae bacterium]